MAKILTFKTEAQAAQPAQAVNITSWSITDADPPQTSALNQRRLAGLAFLEETNKAVDRVSDHERMQRYDADKILFAMRRALDWIPASLLRDLADEVATEYEMRGR